MSMRTGEAITRLEGMQRGGFFDDGNVGDSMNAAALDMALRLLKGVHGALPAKGGRPGALGNAIWVFTTVNRVLTAVNEVLPFEEASDG